MPEDGNLVCDMCIPGYWIGGFHGFHHPRKLHYPVGWGTLGFAFPAALGVALAGTGPTVSISGDGGFLFACGELATMAQERLPFTAVIVDDGGYGMLRYDQVKAGDEPYGVDLHTPDFAAMAASFGVRAETVEGLDDAFGEALARHVADDGAERARGEGGGARAPAHHVAELVPQARLSARRCQLDRDMRGQVDRRATQQVGSPYCSLLIRSQPAKTAGSSRPVGLLAPVGLDDRREGERDVLASGGPRRRSGSRAR